MTTPPLLQPGAYVEPGAAYLPAEPRNVLWGRLPCADDSPVLTVDPGEPVVVDTVSHEGILEDQGRDPVAYFGRRGVPPERVLDDAIAVAGSTIPHVLDVDGPHVVTGPIAVRGARPGDVLAIRVRELRMRAPYGLVSSRHGRSALPEEFPVTSPTCAFCTVEHGEEGPYGVLAPDRLERPVTFRLRPFLGIMGVAAAGSVRPHSVPPGPYGGNLDVTLLGAGSSVYLPVRAEGGLAYVGDPHFAQGDGEVALTAFEAPLRAVLSFDVIPAETALRLFGALAGPLGETPEFLVPIGLDADLNEAMRNCVRSALDLLEARYGLERDLGFAYLSAAGDFAVSQVVDRIKGVHGTIRKSDFAAHPAEPTTATTT